jgi:hypothetical protein
VSRRPATRPRGRPSLDASGAPSAQLCLNLIPADFDRLVALARAERVNVQVVIRRAIARYLRADAPLSPPASPTAARRPRSITVARRLGI